MSRYDVQLDDFRPAGWRDVAESVIEQAAGDGLRLLITSAVEGLLAAARRWWKRSGIGRETVLK